MEDYFELYLDYVGDTEAPMVYHRWSSISMLAALLERDVHIKLGHFDIYPNMYIMLIGAAAARKSSSIKVAKSILKASGFSNFSSEETSREQYLVDLHDLSHKDADETSLEENLFGDTSSDEYTASLPDAVSYIAADEFNDFIGLGNLQFISLLGTLWDYKGVYDRKLKNSKRVAINNPTINILGGNTPTGFAAAFPPEIIGQGFFSRMLLVFGKPTGVKHTFPRPPNPEAISAMASRLAEIKRVMRGEIIISEEAKALLHKSYGSWKDLEDIRFANYSGRRFTHLLKLCIVVSASDKRMIIEYKDVVFANTLLTVAEYYMPKALGEFGKGRNSAISNKVADLIDRSKVPVGITDIIKAVHSDIDGLGAINDILRGLEIAGKIQCVDGKFLPKRPTISGFNSDLFDLSLLHESEGFT